MLFRSRGRGRRSTIRVIYVGLALLMGVGLVGFGIGNRRQRRRHPQRREQPRRLGWPQLLRPDQEVPEAHARTANNLGAWEKLVTAQLHEAGGEAYVTRTGVTGKGKDCSRRSGSRGTATWRLAPDTPTPNWPRRMVAVFGEEGLNDPAAAVGVLQIAVAARPTSASLYGALAQYAYKAHNTPVGDLAAEKAGQARPAPAEGPFETRFESLKKNPSGGGEALTGRTNGKTYTVKPSPGGGYTGTIRRARLPPEIARDAWRGPGRVAGPPPRCSARSSLTPRAC